MSIACDFCYDLALYQCSECTAAFYCSKRCQRHSWLSGHRQQCLNKLYSKRTQVPPDDDDDDDDDDDNGAGNQPLTIVLPAGSTLYHGTTNQTDCASFRPEPTWFSPSAAESALHATFLHAADARVCTFRTKRPLRLLDLSGAIFSIDGVLLSGDPEYATKIEDLELDVVFDDYELGDTEDQAIAREFERIVEQRQSTAAPLDFDGWRVQNDQNQVMLFDPVRDLEFLNAIDIVNDEQLQRYVANVRSRFEQFLNGNGIDQLADFDPFVLIFSKGGDSFSRQPEWLAKTTVLYWNDEDDRAIFDEYRRNLKQVDDPSGFADVPFPYGALLDTKANELKFLTAHFPTLLQSLQQ